MEKDSGNYPHLQNEPYGRKAEGSKSNPEKKDKDKKSKKSSDSSSRASNSGTAPEGKRKDSDKDRAGKALADLIVTRGEGVKEKPEQKKKREAEVTGETKADTEATIEPTTGPQTERTREEITQAHNRPEADDDDPKKEDAKDKPDEKHERAPEHTHDKTAPQNRSEFVELSLSEEPGKEIDLPLEREPRASASVDHEVPEEALPVSDTIPPPGFDRPVATPQAHESVAAEQPDPAEPVIPERIPTSTEFAPGAGAAAEAAAIQGAESPMEPVTEVLSPMDPVEYYYRQSESVAAQHEAGGEPMVTRQAAEDAEYYAARAGQSRGFVTGLFVAGLWGHFKHKKIRRQFNKTFKRQEKQIDKLRNDQHFYNEARQQQQSESDRNLTATQQQLKSVEQQLRSGEAPQAGHVERQLPQRQDTEAAEQLAVPAEHRLETSAWHTIEVDAKTGRAVENPTFAYGHEYYRERAHEATPQASRSSAAGEVVLSALAAQPSDGAQASGGADYQGSGGLPPVDIPSATQQGPPSARTKSDDRSGRNGLSNLSSSGPIWPFILTLLVILACLIFLL